MKKQYLAKWLLQTLFLGAFVVLLSSCSTSQEASKSSSATVEKEYRELIDMLYAVPGIDVTKSGNSYDIKIRGKNTFLMDHQPLFVVDGLALSTEYADIANAVNVNDVDRIRVLKGSEATAYGSRGGNGVIEIYLKRGLK